MVSFPRSSTCLPYCSLSFARYSPTFLHFYSYCSKPGYPRSVRRWHRGEPLAASPIIFQGEISDHVAWIGANSTMQSSKCHLPSFCQGCLGLCIKTARNASTSGTALYQLPCYGARWVQVVTVLEMESSWKFNHENLHKAAPKPPLFQSWSCWVALCFSFLCRRNGTWTQTAQSRRITCKRIWNI